jgi:acyl carrier protein
MFKQVQQTVASTLKVPLDKITETTTSKDIAKWDSLGHINLMMALEETFDVILDVEDFPKLTSLPAIMSYLKKQGIG